MILETRKELGCKQSLIFLKDDGESETQSYQKTRASLQIRADMV